MTVVAVMTVAVAMAVIVPPHGRVYVARRVRDFDEVIIGFRLPSPSQNENMINNNDKITDLEVSIATLPQFSATCVSFSILHFNRSLSQMARYLRQCHSSQLGTLLQSKKSADTTNCEFPALLTLDHTT